MQTTENHIDNEVLDSNKKMFSKCCISKCLYSRGAHVDNRRVIGMKRIDSNESRVVYVVGTGSRKAPRCRLLNVIRVCASVRACQNV